MRSLHVTERRALACLAAAVCLFGAGCRNPAGPEAAGGGTPTPSASASPADTQASAGRGDALPPAARANDNLRVATETPAGAAPQAGSGDGSPSNFEGTAGVSEKKRGDRPPALLREVRTAGHEGFDRVVFEFEGTSSPGYRVEYVDRPVRQCGSGETVPLAGDGWLEVRLTPADAHTEAGAPTVTDRARRPGLRNLKELKLTCDFEAEVTWVLGLAAPNRYRVLEFSNPMRLVVDVRHR